MPQKIRNHKRHSRSVLHFWEGYCRDSIGCSNTQFSPNSTHTWTQTHTYTHLHTLSQCFPQNKETMEAGNGWTLSSAHDGNTHWGSNFCSGLPPAWRHNTHTCIYFTTLSLSLSRAGVPVANHRAAERGSCMTLTLRYTKTWRSSPVGSLQTREGRGDGNNAMKQKTIEY